MQVQVSYIRSYTDRADVANMQVYSDVPSKKKKNEEQCCGEHQNTT